MTSRQKCLLQPRLGEGCGVVVSKVGPGFLLCPGGWPLDGAGNCVFIEQTQRSDRKSASLCGDL